MAELIAVPIVTGVLSLGASAVKLIKEKIKRKSKQKLATIQAERERANREHDLARQNAILQVLKQSSEDALKEQQAEFDQLLNETVQKANEDLDRQKKELLQQQADIETNLLAEIKNIHHSNSDMRNKLMADLENNQQKLLDMDSRAKEMTQEIAKQKDEFLKLLEKKNYEDHYPMPSKLKDHTKAYPNAFRIQILGARGAGKSTFVNKFMKSRVDQFSKST